MCGKHREPGDRRSILGSVALVVFLAGSQFAHAEDSFSGAIAIDELAGIRGGDNDISNSLNTVTTASSSQQTSATNENNTINGDAPSGYVLVQAGSFTDMHGMTNVVMNTAPQSNVQGIMTLNIVLH